MLEYRLPVLTVCIRVYGDPKGLYKRARSGEIANFTGISSPYEPPSAAELTIETDKMHVEACVAKIVGYVEHHLRLPDRASI
jgi:adenylylsulfate kinase-like enzyme